MQNRLYVVVSEPFLETAAMGIGFLSQWKKHYFCRGIQDRLFFRGTGSLPVALREKLFLYLLAILGWSTYFIFSSSLPESAVRQYFKSLICFWSHYISVREGERELEWTFFVISFATGCAGRGWQSLWAGRRERGLGWHAERGWLPSW
jgi:hypothetical protein